MKKRFAILLIVLIGWLVFLSLSGCHKPVINQETAENETEWMPDKNLRQAVWEALKLDPGTSPTPQALAGLTKLELVTFSTPYQQKILSLKGLEHATGLEVLRLYKHQVKDITPLTNLTKLEWLVLYDHEISDLTPLANLTGLKKLDLDSNRIKDITPLLRLTGLQELHLSGNRNITDFTPLTALTGLEALSLSRNRIKDLTLLSRLTGLTRLVIYGSEISDLTPLAKLKGLRELDLSDNEIRDITPLAKLNGLTQLKLSGNKITDLTPLAKLTGLTELVLWDNEITDLTPLAKLKGLEALVLGSIQVVDINGLSSLTNLKDLELWKNEITDLTPLANLKGLTQLELNSNQVVDITPLANLTGLTQLELKDNPIQDVTPLYTLRDRNPNLRIEMPLPEPDLIPDANLAEAVREALGLAPGHPFSREDLQDLRRLPLRTEGVTDLTGLQHATQLAYLVIINNKISDLTPLANLNGLEKLYLSHNEIRDITPLAKLKELRELDLSHNEIRDITPLAKLNGLQELYLSDNEISDITPLAKLNGLEGLERNDRKINEIAYSPPPLANLMGLQELYLSHNEIRDITPLAKLKELRELDLSHNEIRDITPLAKLKELHRLELENNQIRDISALTQLTNFDWLKVRSTTNLVALRIRSNPIQDVTPLRTLFKSNPNMKIDVGFTGKFLYPVMYWVDMEKGTLHHCIGDTVVNLLPDIQNATRLALNPYYSYWTEKTDANTWRIRRASKHTTTPQITDFREELTAIPMDMATANNLIYVLVASGKIQHFQASFYNFEPDFITGLASPKHLVTDVLDEKLYWTEKTTDGTWQIQCATLDGSNIQLVRTLPSMPIGLAIDVSAGDLYVSVASGKIQRLRVDGSDFQPDFITGLVSPGSLGVDARGGKVYWTEKGGIWRASLTGENIECVITGLGMPANLVLDE